MLYQQTLPFVKEFRGIFKIDGAITPELFLKNYYTEESYSEILRKAPEELRNELKRIGRLLKKEGKEGTLFLMPWCSRDYFPENFFPKFFIDGGELIQEERRRIYRVSAMKRDGSRKDIMVKGTKFSRSFLYDPPKEWLTDLASIKLFKKSSKELQELIKLNKFSIKTEKPLGHFRQGLEQWLFTEYMEGENPLKLLEDQKMRKKLWAADATLLAKLCKAKSKHQYFYSKEFDDKLWVGEELALIDVDEQLDMLNRKYYKDYFAKNPDKLIPYQLDWLKDCIMSYLSHGLMREEEAYGYIKTFLKTMNLEDICIKEIIKEAKNPKRITEENYFALMSDCN